MVLRVVAVGIVGLLAFVALFWATGSYLGGAIGALAAGTIGLSWKIGASWATRTRIRIMLWVAVAFAALGAVEYFTRDKINGLVGILAALFLVIGAGSLHKRRMQSHER